MVVNIRPVQKADAAALAEIYRPYVEETAITFECEAPSAEAFGRRIEAITARYPFFVAEDAAGRPCGYAYASAFKDRAAYDWSVETSIYVARDRRGQGVGRALYERLEACLRRQNVRNMYACLAAPRPENDRLDASSRLFHEHLGFRLVGTFSQCAYKFGQWYDMIWLEKFLAPHTATVASFRPCELRVRERHLPTGSPGNGTLSVRGPMGSREMKGLNGCQTSIG